MRPNRDGILNTPDGLNAVGQNQAQAPKLKKAIQTFLRRDLSPNTMKAFGADLKPFVAAYGNLRVNEIGSARVLEHLDGLTTRQGKPVSDATYNRHFGTLLNFFRWLDEFKKSTAKVRAQLVYYRNPMFRLHRRKLPDKLPRPLTKDQVQTILARVDGPRDRALFTLLYDSGLRIQEALNLNVDDLDLADGSMRVLGKGERERTAFLSKKACLLLKRHLRDRRNPVSGPVFVSRQYSDRGGHRLSYAMAYRLFRRYSDGIQHNGQQATIHQLRHSFGSERAGVIDSLALKQLMGHRSLRTTLQYAEVNPEAARNAFIRYEASRMHS